MTRIDKESDCWQTPQRLFNDDCFNIFPQLENNSIDLVLCDMPYGTTQCKWDTILDLSNMWDELKRIVKQNSAIVLFSQMPFSARLVTSNYKNYRYEIIWEKSISTGFLNANKMPLKAHENIQVFYAYLPTYNPQFSVGKPYKAKPGKKYLGENYRTGKPDTLYNEYQPIRSDNLEGKRYPNSIVKIANNNSGRNKLHPTQKPVALMEYLIKTYSNEGDTVLDFCMGSGTTGVACKNLNRSFIGIEKEEKYYQIAKERIGACND